MTSTEDRRIAEAARSYSRDARKFRAAGKLGKPIISAEQDAYWASVYQSIADELRKVAATRERAA